MCRFEQNRKAAKRRWSATRERMRAQFARAETSAVARAALCGFLAGDGSIFCQRQGFNVNYKLRCFPDDDLMLDAYVQFMREVYNVEPKVRACKGYFDVVVYARAVSEDLLRAAPFGIRQWRVPPLETDEERAAWLRGFFSAEGYVGVKSIRVQTVNAEGMQQVSTMLLALGIEHRRYIYTPVHAKHAPVHIITILRRSARAAYAARIGFWHAAKLEKLRKQQL